MCGILLCVEWRRDGGGGGGDGGVLASTSASTSEDSDSSALLSSLSRRGPDACGTVVVRLVGEEGCSPACTIRLHSSVLHVRGLGTPTAPCRDGHNVLCYNGEVFGGVDVDETKGDTQALMEALTEAASGGADDDVVRTIARVRGPWAFVFWHAGTQTLWFGRDIYGRRSLLAHVPRDGDRRLMLTSVAPPSARAAVTASSDTSSDASETWTELPPGVYSIRLACLEQPIARLPEAHPWPAHSVPWMLASHKRADNLCAPPPTDDDDAVDSVRATAASEVLAALTAAVRVRVADTTLRAYDDASVDVPDEDAASASLPAAAVAVLFSGGVDSALLARLASECLPANAAIDLVNVCFANGTSPDRITARDAAEELSEACTDREFRLVEATLALEDVEDSAHRLMELLHPTRTHMDYNVGAALWFAAACRGSCRVYQGSKRVDVPGLYQGRSKVLLVGGGADEQCCGYGRHRTKFRNGGWPALVAESALDMERLWLRNCGRDDRVVSDRGREMRWPFLDEALVLTLLAQPLWAVADLSQPAGVGDKAVLREAARRLGLARASARPKRAVQFGTRIAQQSNCKKFGSNSRANKAHGGALEMVL